MTPKESLLKELETADEALIAETLSWVRSRKQNLAEALAIARALPTQYQRASALADIAKLDSTHFAEALDAARAIPEPEQRALSFSKLAKIILPEVAVLEASPTSRALISALLKELNHSPMKEEPPDQEPETGSSLVEFFRNSPLAEIADEIDLSRDKRIFPDRISL